MKTFKHITAAALVLFSVSVNADSNDVFSALFSALSKVAAQQQARNGANQQEYYDDQYGDNGYQQAGYYDQAPRSINLSGRWGMRSGKVNRFQKTYDGYHVIPVGRGKGVHYVEIGENLYQDANGSGTYKVINRDYMIWSSNDKRNIEIELFRQ